MRVRDTAERGRGWGPFTGRQLTTVIVAVCATVVLMPFAAGAASAVFTSSGNATPAVTGTNTASAGIGVQGSGKKYGVFSAGPLGVAAGKPLSCIGCVKPGALSASAKELQPLAAGESESGLFYVGPSTASGPIGTSITYTRRLGSAIQNGHTIDVSGASAPHCPGIGQADPGYLCLYSQLRQSVSTFATFTPLGGLGAVIGWVATAANAQVQGRWTVTAAP
jgi:hypothetical protein